MRTSRLRRFAREGAAENSDLDEHHRRHGENAGWLDPKHAAGKATTPVKVLLLPRHRRFDGRPRRICEELFSACRKRVQAPRALLLPQLRSRRRLEGQSAPPQSNVSATLDVMHQLRQRLQARSLSATQHEPPTRCSILAAASSTGNEEPGATWMQRMTEAIFSQRQSELNRAFWQYRQSTGADPQLWAVGRDVPRLTLDGLGHGRCAQLSQQRLRSMNSRIGAR